MPEYHNHDIHQVAQEILGYLDAHPAAADSVEGIVEWWLARKRYEDAKRHVPRALEYLLAQGLVEKTRLVSGGSIYSKCKTAKE